MYVVSISFVAVGLADDPSEEIADISPAFGEHADGDHVEHLNGLVEFDVESSQVEQPKQKKAECREHEI